MERMEEREKVQVHWNQIAILFVSQHSYTQSDGDEEEADHKKSVRMKL